MTDPVTPPLFGDAPARACSRWLGDRNCGLPPVAHVLWDDEMENGFVCAEHLQEVGTTWTFVQMHDLSPDCGMPGASWWFDENTCRCDDELEAAPEEELELVGQDRTGTARGQHSVAVFAESGFDQSSPNAGSSAIPDTSSKSLLFQALETASRLYARDSRHFRRLSSGQDRTGTAPHQQIARLA